MVEQTFMMKRWMGRPSVVSNDLVKKINEKVCENQRITISQLSEQFTQWKMKIMTLYISTVNSHP